MNRARSETRHGAGRAARAAALAWMLPCLLGAGVPAARPTSPAAAPAAVQDDPGGARAFQIYDTQAARALADDVVEHLEEGRTAEALAGLQTLLEEQDTSVLALPSRPDVRRPRHERFQGAASWALETLLSLPADARELYAERHAARAEASLRRGLARHDVDDLMAVARRWPLTHAARTALLAAGDLECEAGHLELAASAWGRALALVALRPAGPDSPEAWRAQLAEVEARTPDTGPARRLLAGLAARAERVLAEDVGAGALDDSRGLTSISGRPARGRPYSDDTDPWPQPVTLPPGPFQGPASADTRLYPVRAGERVFVSTSRAVVAVGAHTGQPLWSTESTPLVPGRPPWSEVRETGVYNEAVDVREGLIAPAVGQGVVVAPLQVPVVVESSQNYNQMEIIKVQPERRLFAFDARDGRLLWGHPPPANWDGDSGDLAERASVVGPPVVVGSRVLVPCVNARGRLDFRVACYDLHTGEALWSTPIISGQRSLNMFGRMTGEFVAPPVSVEGTRVVCLTQLGVVSCLDLFSGAPLWQVAYPQIRMERGHYTRDSHLASVWRNAPARVVGDAVVAAPVDSNYLVAYSLRDGEALWELSHIELGDMLSPTRGGARLSRLVGADETRVYLDGRRLAAFEVPVGDLAERAPTRLAWAYPADSEGSLDSFRASPVLAGRSLYVPDGAELIELDAGTGRRRSSFTWPETRGNLLLDDGSLFTVNSTRLCGHFEWESMVARARAEVAAHPDDPHVTEELAALLVQRGVSTRTRATDARGLAEAARYLGEARQLLERLAASNTGGLGEPARKTLFRALTEQAVARRLALDPRGARESLEAALPLAPTHVAAMETLLVLQQVLRGRDEDQRRLVLSELRDSYGVVSHVCFPLEGGGADRPAIEERLAALEPVAARIVGDRTRRGLMLPVELFARIELAQSYATSRDPADVAAEFEELYAILAENGEVPLVDDLLASSWATERIAHMLEHGRTAGHDRIEERARVALESARDLNDEAALAEVVRRYPLTRAAHDANDARLEAALGSGDTDRAAAIVIGALPDGWNPERASDRELQQLMLLADLFRRQDNRELAAGLARRLAEHHGETDLRLGSRTQPLSSWADEWQADAAPPALPAPPSFRPDAEVLATHDEGLDWIGTVSTDDGAQPVVVFRRNAGLQTFSGGDADRVQRKLLGPTDQLDRAGLERRTAVTRGRVHLATPARVMTVRSSDNETLWHWRSDAYGGYEALSETSGVLVVSQTLGGSTANAVLLVGLDAATGVELWRYTFSGQRYRARVVAGEGWVVLMPQTSGVAQVLDAFTGALQSRFPVEYARRGLAEGAWIEGGRILLPGFTQLNVPQHNRLQAVDLRTGQDAWVLPLARTGQQRELESVLQYGGRTYLLLATVEAGGRQSRALHELSTRTGALDVSPVVRLSDNERLVGVSASARHVLPSEAVVSVHRESDGRDSTLSGWSLRFGREWTVRVDDRFLLYNTSDLPLPVSSGDATALVVQGWQEGAQRSRKQPFLLLVDEGASRFTALPVSDPAPRSSGRAALVPYAGGLFVCGEETTKFLR